LDIATETSAIERVRTSRRAWWWVGQVPRLIGKSRSQVYRDIGDGKLVVEREAPRKTKVRKAALVRYLKQWDES